MSCMCGARQGPCAGICGRIRCQIGLKLVDSHPRVALGLSIVCPRAAEAHACQGLFACSAPGQTGKTSLDCHPSAESGLPRQSSMWTRTLNPKPSRCGLLDCEPPDVPASPSGSASDARCPAPCQPLHSQDWQTLLTANGCVHVDDETLYRDGEALILSDFTTYHDMA